MKREYFILKGNKNLFFKAFKQKYNRFREYNILESSSFIRVFEEKIDFRHSNKDLGNLTYDILGKTIIFFKKLSEEDKIELKEVFKGYSVIQHLKISGEKRVRECEILQGDSQVVYTAQGISQSFDYKKVYFSSRLGNIRKTLTEYISKKYSKDSKILIAAGGLGFNGLLLAKEGFTNVEVLDINIYGLYRAAKTASLYNFPLKTILGDYNDVKNSSEYDVIVINMRTMKLKDFPENLLDVKREIITFHLVDKEKFDVPVLKNFKFEKQIKVKEYSPKEDIYCFFFTK